MPVDKIRVEGDERIRYEYATLNGRKYGELQTILERLWETILRTFFQIMGHF